MRLIALALATTLAACASSTTAGGGATTTDTGALADAGSSADSGSTTDGGAKADTGGGADTTGGDAGAGKDAGSDSGNNTLDPFTQLLQDVLDATVAPGVSVAAVEGGQVSKQQAHGIGDIDEEMALGTNHAMRWGEVSQLVVAVAVMQQVEAGKLNLDADVGTYVGFPVKNPKHDAKITLRMLLAHTSSALDTEALVWDVPAPGEPTQTLADFCKSYFSSADAWSKDAPGAVSAPTYVGPALAALAVEKVTAQDFADYTKAKLFAPAGLKSTGWRVSDVASLAWPHLWDETENVAAYDDTYGVPYYPSVTLCAPPSELAKLLSLFTNKGMVDGKALLKPESVDEILKEQFPKATDSEGMGLGWYPTVVGEDSQEVWFSFGLDWGWTGAVALSKDKKHLAVLAVNLEIDFEDEFALGSIDTVLAALLTGKTP